MREEEANRLDEMDYIQLGKLDCVRIKPLRESNGYLNDVEVIVTRKIPRYDFESNSSYITLDDLFVWSITAKWDDILDPSKEVQLSHGFRRDTNSFVGSSHLSEHYSGRRFCVTCNPEWDFIKALKLLKQRPRYQCLYRYVEGEWHFLEPRETVHDFHPGNIWRADLGKEIVETHKFVSVWKRLD